MRAPSRPRKGSRCRLSVPPEKGRSAPPGTRTHRLAPRRRGEAVDQGQPRVLVVEDNLLIAMETESLVEECGCAVVGPAASVSEALHVAGYTGLEGAVLDINLDRERVWPVAEVLKERGVPFVFATAYSGAEVPERFMHHTLLTKPLERDSLLEALREIGTISG
ncbi:MAG: response regulator [Alphaproteobacteria bacterium]|nr:response regulator [Alphaproteobacteria bacterium]